MSSIYQRAMAELFGTFWLVLGGVGAAVLLGPQIGPLGVALAFGLVLLTLAYAIGHISGCHVNPAVTIGMWVAKQFPSNEILPYIIAQVVGGVIGAAVLYFIMHGSNMAMGSFGANGFAEHSPGGFNMMSGFVTEAVVTFMFMFIILGATSPKAPAGFAPIAIGLALTSMHLLALPVTNAAINPARALASAVFVGDWAISQLWLFWVAPILGAGVAGLLVGDRNKF